MNRRLLILLLAIAMIFTVVLPAFATDTSAYDLKAEEAEEIPSVNLEFARAMGLLESSVPGSTPFTRGELARLVTNILLSGADVSTFETTNEFSDVKGEIAPYVSAAVDLNIMNGYGDGTFGPDDRVTYIQLLKTMVCLLERGVVAESKGGYPSGYYVVASRLDLTYNAPENMNAEMTYIGVADVLKYMVDVNVARYNNNDELEILNKNYLEHYLNIGIASGVVDGIGSVTLDSRPLDHDRISIGGKSYAASKEILENHGYFALSVDAYYRENKNNQNEVFYIETRENDVLEIDADDLISVTQNGITYYSADGKNKTAKFDINTVVIKNEEVLGNYSQSTFMPFLNANPEDNKDGKVMLYSTDDDSIYDVIRVFAYDTYIVSRIDNGQVYNKYHGDFILDLDSLKEGQLVNVLYQPIEFAALKKGHVISVLKDSAGNITKVIVTLESYSGIVREIVGTDRVERINIDGNWYEMSWCVLKCPNLRDLKVGKKIMVYFNPEGRICDIDGEDFVSYEIGYLINSRKEGPIVNNVYVKLLAANGSIQQMQLNEKVEVEVGNALKGRMKAEDAIAAAGYKDGKIKRQPILYRLSGDKKIEWIRYVDLSAAPMGDKDTADGLYAFNGEEAYDGSRYYYRRGSISGEVMVMTSTVIFVVPPDGSPDVYSDYAYTVSSSDSIGSDNNFGPITAYGVKINNPTAALAVIKKDSASISKPGEDSDFIVIKDIYKALDEDGSEATKIVGIRNRAEVSFFTLDKYAAQLEIGDVIQIGSSVDGLVQQIHTMFKVANFKKGDSFDPETDGMGVLADGTVINMNPYNVTASETVSAATSVSSGNPRRRVVYGKAYFKDANALSVKWTESIGGPVNVETHPVAAYPIILVDTSGRETVVTSANAAVILTELDNGEYASNVIIHDNNMSPKVIVVYK